MSGIPFGLAFVCASYDTPTYPGGGLLFALFLSNRTFQFGYLVIHVPLLFKTMHVGFIDHYYASQSIHTHTMRN